MDSGRAAVVECRFFGGLDVDETAAALNLSTATVSGTGVSRGRGSSRRWPEDAGGLKLEEDTQRRTTRSSCSSIITAKRVFLLTAIRSLRFTAVRSAGFTSEGFFNETCTHGESQQCSHPVDPSGFGQAMVGRTREGAPLCRVFG